MKAAPFEHSAAESLEETLALLAQGGDETMILAGGQTLVPMMAMRLARPAHLVDINGVAELVGIAEADGWLTIRAGTRQAQALASPVIRERLPLLAKALGFVGHRQTRARGTVGGSMAHGDPASEIPLVATALGAEIALASRDGKRDVAAEDFFEGPMMTAREAAECLTEIRFPVWQGRVGTGFQEISQRHGDFAVVAVAVQLGLDDGGTCRQAAVAIGGAHSFPLRIPEVEQALVSEKIDAQVAEAAAARIGDQLDAPDDLHASAAYRRRVARALAQRAIAEAAGDAP